MRVKRNPASGAQARSLEDQEVPSRNVNQYISYNSFGNWVRSFRIFLTLGLRSVRFPLAEAIASVSAAKKAVPGLSTCTIKPRSEPRQILCGFSVFAIRWIVPMGRAFEATSVGRFGLSGVDNLVRPARHFINMTSRVHSNRKEASHA